MHGKGFKKTTVKEEKMNEEDKQYQHYQKEKKKKKKKKNKGRTQTDFVVKVNTYARRKCKMQKRQKS